MQYTYGIVLSLSALLQCLYFFVYSVVWRATQKCCADFAVPDANTSHRYCPGSRAWQLCAAVTKPLSIRLLFVSVPLCSKSEVFRWHFITKRKSSRISPFLYCKRFGFIVWHAYSNYRQSSAFIWAVSDGFKGANFNGATPTLTRSRSDSVQYWQLCRQFYLFAIR